MDEKSCHNCIEYKKGECLGTEVCPFFKPAPSGGPKEYWPKEMRSRTSYAGSNKTGYGVNYAFNSKNNRNQEAQKKISNEAAKRAKKEELLKTIGFSSLNGKSLNSIDKLLNYLDGKVIAWISFDTNSYASGVKYNAHCLLQYKDVVGDLKVRNITQKRIERAMLDGVLEVANRITKPCTIYLITDRTLFNVNEARDDDRIQKIVMEFAKKECLVRELSMEFRGSKEMIHNQVCSPVKSGNSNKE